MRRPSSTRSQAQGINARGDIVGAYSASVSGQHLEHGYVLKKGAASAVAIIVAGFEQVFPISINAAGQVVGVLNEVWKGFPLEAGCQGFYRSRDGVVQVLESTCTVGINASGEISGAYYDQKGVPHGFIVPKEMLLQQP
jgi:hypothetical protein